MKLCSLRVIFKKNFLSIILLLGFLFFQTSYALKQIQKSQEKIIEMYEKENLADCDLFAGGFINFGYWSDPFSTQKISLNQRIESEKELYRFILKQLKITRHDTILEVGAGQGAGSVLTFLEFHPKELRAIDFSKLQIYKAQKKHAKLIQNASGNLVFEYGMAEHIPYKNNSFNILFSIEAAQHFTDIEAFFRESFLVLKPGGKLAVATFFATSDQAKPLLLDMIQTAHDGIDTFWNIETSRRILKKIGFENVRVLDIGKNVWPGFDRWISQGKFKDTWDRNWYTAYKQGLVSYYVIIADKQPLPVK